MVETLNYDRQTVDEIGMSLRDSLGPQFPDTQNVKIDWNNTSHTFLAKLRDHGYVITKAEDSS